MLVTLLNIVQLLPIANKALNLIYQIVSNKDALLYLKAANIIALVLLVSYG